MKRIHLLVSGRPGDGEPRTGGDESTTVGATEGLSDSKDLLLLLFSSFALLLCPSFIPPLPLPLPLPLPGLFPLLSLGLLFFMVNLGSSSLNNGEETGEVVLVPFLSAFLLLRFFSPSMAFLMPPYGPVGAIVSLDLFLTVLLGSKIVGRGENVGAGERDGMDDGGTDAVGAGLPLGDFLSRFFGGGTTKKISSSTSVGEVVSFAGAAFGGGVTLVIVPLFLPCFVSSEPLTPFRSFSSLSMAKGTHVSLNASVVCDLLKIVES